jgi:hypothetical protein
METDPREREIALRLRAVIAVAVVIGIVAALLDPKHDGPLVGALFVPAAWVCWRPRWGQIVVWGMWLVPIVMMLVLVNVGRASHVKTPTLLLVGMVAVLVIIVMPLVRLGHRAPPLRSSKVPPARVVKS